MCEVASDNFTSAVKVLTNAEQRNKDVKGDGEGEESVFK